MADPLEEAAAEIRRRIETRVAEIMRTDAMADLLKLHRNLNGLEEMLGQAKSGLAGLFGLSGAEDSPGLGVRFDEFYGVTALDAAKRYLKKKSDARPFDEIVRAIKEGGGKVENEEELRKGLSRSTLDIVKIKDRYGALEKYPHIKRGGKRRRASGEAEEEEPDANGEQESNEEEGSRG